MLSRARRALTKKRRTGGAAYESNEIQKELYWPFHFIPEPEGYDTNIDSRQTLHQLCNKCIYIRNRIVKKRTKGLYPDDAWKYRDTFPHYADSNRLIESAHAGCHLCSLMSFRFRPGVTTVYRVEVTQDMAYMYVGPSSPGRDTVFRKPTIHEPINIYILSTGLSNVYQWWCEAVREKE